jgi:hypothetical protein
MVLASLAVIRAAAADVYDQALRLPPSWPRWAGTVFLLGLVAFIALLAVGVLRRSRWSFWLILLAFLAGGCGCRWQSCNSPMSCPRTSRAGTSCSRGSSAWPSSPSGWAMLVGFRRSGVWGAV